MLSGSDIPDVDHVILNAANLKIWKYLDEIFWRKHKQILGFDHFIPLSNLSYIIWFQAAQMAPDLHFFYAKKTFGAQLHRFGFDTPSEGYSLLRKTKGF